MNTLATQVSGNKKGSGFPKLMEQRTAPTLSMKQIPKFQSGSEPESHERLTDTLSYLMPKLCTWAMPTFFQPHHAHIDDQS